MRTTYEPVSANVAVGDVVGRDGVIGTLQRASSHCFPRACLHWGLLRGETYLNPLTLVGAGPVRLLPFAGIPAHLGLSRPSPAPQSAGGRTERCDTSGRPPVSSSTLTRTARAVSTAR